MGTPSLWEPLLTLGPPFPNSLPRTGLTPAGMLSQLLNSRGGWGSVQEKAIFGAVFDITAQKQEPLPTWSTHQELKIPSSSYFNSCGLVSRGRSGAGDCLE